jgi:hypothetical protein
MPVVLCQNVRLNSAREERRCRKILGDLPLEALSFLKSHEGTKLVYRCPVCKWVAIGYENGKLTFYGDVPPPDFQQALTFDEAKVCTQVG